MSASHTNTLEINNDAAPAEVLDVEASTPLNQTTINATEANDIEIKAEELTGITDQATHSVDPAPMLIETVSQDTNMTPTANPSEATTSDAERSMPITDITPKVPVISETNTEMAMHDNQSLKPKETEFADANENKHQTTQPIITHTKDNTSITDNSVNELQTTSSHDANTVAVTEAPTQPAINFPINTDWIIVIVFLLTAGFLSITNRREIKKAAQLAQVASRPATTMPIQAPTVDVEFEKAKAVAESRQKWIHSLREEVAKFVSATNAVWDLHKIKDGCEDILTDMNDPQFVMKELYHWSCTYNKAIQDTEQLYTKIHLLINPNEEKAQTLCKLLDRTMVAVEAKKSPSKSNDDIIAITQEILKDEWERVKTFN